uniref:Uncharacterized protein n=1 Tax=Plectus sambesii TaxID=2011161 RepID=A0A914VH22_9BILA
MLGATKPGRHRIDWLTWLWTDEVQEKVRQKKKQYQRFLAAKTPENWKAYKEAWSAAKTAVASVQGPVLPIQRYEVADAIGKMECGKATGPDNIPADLWKAKN